jgi:alkaline phosphatase D
VAQWDDHEVLDNWDPLHHDPLARLARQAFLEFWPVSTAPRMYRKVAYGPDLELFVLDLRSYRAPNGANRQSEVGPETVLLGREQLDWLKKELEESKATWKFIAGEMPLCTYNTQWGLDSWANGEGPPLGRELELAELLSFLKRQQIQRVVWLSADVHYAAAIHYHPDRAQFKDFLPFWEFIAGPLHAGTFPPALPLDPTFGAKMVHLAVPPDMPINSPPSAGHQFFGRVHLKGPRGRVSMHRRDGAQVFGEVL